MTRAANNSSTQRQRGKQFSKGVTQAQACVISRRSVRRVGIDGWSPRTIATSNVKRRRPRNIDQCRVASDCDCASDMRRPKLPKPIDKPVRACARAALNMQEQSQIHLHAPVCPVDTHGWATGELQDMVSPHSIRCAVACPCRMSQVRMSRFQAWLTGCSSVPGRRTHEPWRPQRP